MSYSPAFATIWRSGSSMLAMILGVTPQRAQVFISVPNGS
jgi:hypothetical protein